MTNEIPTDLLAELQRDFSEMELAQIYFCIHKSLAPHAEQPAALFVFGPPAVGKSSIANARATALFGSPENAVLIDGSEFRDVHGGWRDVMVHGTTHSVLHADAWDVFKATKVSAKLKQRAFREAIRDRQHLVIPDCATEMHKIEEMLDTLVEAGYALHCLCMYAPLNETRERGLPRSRSEGKLWTPTQYHPSVAGSLEMAMRFADGLRGAASAPAGSAASLYKSLVLWDNTVFPATPVTLDEFCLLSAFSDKDADAHAARLKRKLKPQHHNHVDDASFIATPSHLFSAPTAMLDDERASHVLRAAEVSSRASSSSAGLAETSHVANRRLACSSSRRSISGLMGAARRTSRSSAAEDGSEDMLERGAAAGGNRAARPCGACSSNTDQRSGTTLFRCCCAAGGSASASSSSSSRIWSPEAPRARSTTVLWARLQGLALGVVIGGGGIAIALSLSHAHCT